ARAVAVSRPDPPLRRGLRGRVWRGWCHPEAVEVQLDRVEGLDADGVGASAHGDDRPRTVPQAQDFERALGRVHEPRVRDTRAGIDPQLASAVDTLGRGREYLTNAVGSDCEECL